MTDLSAAELDAEALALIEEAAKPKRRVRPRLARRLAEADDREIETPHGPVMAWRLGEGPASLLVHGWEDDNALWSPLIDACTDIFRAVVVLDLPGHGFSPTDSHSVEAAGEALLAIAEAMGPIDSIVAHSFGCHASLYAMAHGLQVHRAVMIGSPVPFTKAPDSDRPRPPWVQRQIERGADPQVAQRADELRRQRQDESGVTEKVEATIAAMTARALILHSEDDGSAAASNSIAMAGLWPGSELFLMDGLGHRLIAQDREVVERIINFLEDFS
jgi:pimeloyl-ACP methyl ester carboxylesterase